VAAVIHELPPELLKPLLEATAGAGLKLTVEQAKKVGEAINNHSLAGMGSRDHWALAKEAAKELAKAPEYLSYKPFITSKNQGAIIRFGMVLRRHAKDEPVVTEIKDALKALDPDRGVVLAQASQAELLPVIIQEYTRGATDDGTYRRNVQRALQHIEEYVYFVYDGIDEATAENSIASALHQRRPPVYCIAGSGQAVDSTRAVANGVAAKARKLYVMEWRQAEGRVSAIFRPAEYFG